MGSAKISPNLKFLKHNYMEGIELREKMDLISQDVKELLLKGNFQLFGYDGMMQFQCVNVDVSGIPIKVRIHHNSKEAAPEGDFLMWHNLTPDERKSLYLHIATGGISIAIKNTEIEIERLKKELVNMKLLKESHGSSSTQ